MAKAKYSRESVHDQIVYNISPLSLWGWRSWTMFGTLLFAPIIGGFLWVVLWVFNVATGWTGFLIMTAGVAYFFYRRSTKGFGARETSRVIIASDEVTIERSYKTQTVKRDTIRRLRYFNTASQFAPVAYENSAHAQMSSEVHEAVEKNCWGIQLDHGNDTVVVSDGLDVVTCQNILEDFSRDLFKH